MGDEVNLRSKTGIAGDTLYQRMNLTADQMAEISLYTGVEFIYGLSESVSTRLIQVLQDFFMAYPIGKAFNAALKNVNKEVIILDDFAPDTQQLPQVVVNSMPQESMPVSLGNRVGREEYGELLFDVHQGLVNIATTWSIYEVDKPSLGRLADVLFLAFMQYVPYNMRRTGMTPQPKISFTNPGKLTGTKLGGSVFMSRMNVLIVSEWMQYMEIETIDTEKIEHQPSVEGGETPLR